MLEDYFSKPTTLDRIRQSWIAPLIEKHLAWMETQGHAKQTIHRRIPLLVQFGEFAKDRGATAIPQLKEYASDFVTYFEERSRCCRPATRQKVFRREVRGCIRQFLCFDDPGYDGRSKSRRTVPPSFPFLEAFYAFLREERGLSKASFRVYDYSLRLLQSYLEQIGVVDIKELSPPILSSFVIDTKDRFGKASLIRVLSPIRVLLRYLFRERILERDLSGVVELPHTYELASLPRSISWDEVRRMLEAVDLRTPVGRRDYAILLLIVTYGLRAREIAAIKLDDIDWKNERLLIKARKAGHSTGYPLSAVVGNTILEYLKKDRPQTKERALFFCMKAPIVPLTWQAVSGRALHYLRLAGIDVPKCGSHTLRHTCVQRLVDAQFSLKMIGDYVGHKSPDATRIYAKVDIESLREMALGLGEDLL